MHRRYFKEGDWVTYYDRYNNPTRVEVRKKGVFRVTILMKDKIVKVKYRELGP